LPQVRLGPNGYPQGFLEQLGLLWDGRPKSGYGQGVTGMKNNNQRLPALAAGLLACLPLAADEQEEGTRGSAPVAFNYVGDDVRIDIGYDSATDFTGEFFWSFAEDPDSAWVAQGWFGNDSAGGVKLNYHWLADGVAAGQDESGRTVFTDGKVRKLFMAADQNRFDDRKISFGGGSESEHLFWSLYGSAATTDERFLGRTREFEELLFEGVMNNHAWTRTDVRETITDYFEHPYDRGVGFRVGRYFDQSLVRLRGGLDYETGDYSSSQLSASLGLEKRFRDTGHGLSVQAQFLHKSGGFEVDQDDARLSVLWTYGFGSAFQPAAVYRDVQVERIPAPSELPRERVVEMVRNQVTLDHAASFELDKADLNDAARRSLEAFVGSLEDTRIVGEIRVVGHTCSLGTERYNQSLSERRAGTVYDFLVGAGVDPAVLRHEGRGESEPRYSNDTEASRSRNRRVEISFLAEREVVREVIVGEGEPITEWVQEKVPVEAAWIRRALRNPVMHKRTVDFYRYNRATENYTTGETIVANSGPYASDDSYAFDQDSGEHLLAVLANDSDPEGDTLTLVAVGAASGGSAVISGTAITYTPNPGFHGTDTFSYTIEDAYGGRDTAQVTVKLLKLNELPLAVDDSYSVPEDSSNNLFDVLGNDSDPDGDDLTILSVTTPPHGTASISGNAVVYTPDPGYFGADSFGYTVEDGNGGEDSALVSVVVEEHNNPPVAADDFASTYKNTPVVIEVLANDQDPDGDPLAIVEIIQAENAMGFVVINGDGTVTYTPVSGWWGGDWFHYRISDGRGGTDVATVTLDVINP
jgi:outer membrane protein OmpA-like peptidoglycan-associated protein